MIFKTLGSVLNSFGVWFNRTFDFSDFIGFGGLGMVFHGLYQREPYLAFIIVGGIIFTLSVAVSARR